MLAVAEQVNEVIGFTSGRNNFSKDLKQDLLQLRKLLALAKKKKEDLLVEE